MGPGAGGRGLMVSDSARARAIEVLKAKEKELVTKVTSWAPHICDETTRYDCRPRMEETRRLEESFVTRIWAQQSAS